ncbi:L-type lectin-domain containing receptor kinase IV.2 [Linum perenne]
MAAAIRRFILLTLLLHFTTRFFSNSQSPVNQFTFNGFNRANLLFDNQAKILPNGLLQLTNFTELVTGHAFYHQPFRFVSSDSLSFSTTFVFAMVPQSSNTGGHGIAFTISPTTNFSQAVASQHLGLFNTMNMGNSSNHVVAVELDAMRSPEFEDIDDNHVGVDLNTLIIAIAAYVLRLRRYRELTEDWEREYNPQRLCYKDLYRATHGFREKEVLGSGGFGKVYRGILPTSKIEVAVKRISHDSRQGMKEFVAEIVSMGRLRHRNLVQLLGYCRRKGELLLVYDYMPSGSLDKYLFEPATTTLNWPQRFKILRGVASGLLYLHEEWEQIVLHRDIKASNVLLDADMNGRLGDFGLARLYDHGTNPQTTHVVGTVGYLAPELSRLGKATTATDVYAFGVFMLEVACAIPEEMILVDWVIDCWKRGDILEASDPKLGGDYAKEEMEMVMKLGLLCSHNMEAFRPSMRQVMQYLDGDSNLPEVPLESSGIGAFAIGGRETAEFVMSFRSSVGKDYTTVNTMSSTDSVLHSGR